MQIDQKLTNFGEARGPWPEGLGSGKPLDVVFGGGRGAWK